MESKTYSHLTFLVVVISLFTAFLGWLTPEMLLKIQYPLLILLVLSIGLPHGATDFLLFRRLQRVNLSRKQIFTFFIYYLLTIIGFLVLWFVFPLLSFIIFIIISSYHFGQSNWENIKIPRSFTFLINLFWGAFAVGGPVFWHWDESQMVISQVIGFTPDFSAVTLEKVQFGLVVINIVLVFLLKTIQSITLFQFYQELVKILVLSCLFYFTPMLIGFALYFGLWHALHSLLSQLSFYKKIWPEFTILDYYRQAAPYTIISVLGFFVMMVGHPYVLPEVSMISTFLIFIACVTLPHVLLIEESYRTPE